MCIVILHVYVMMDNLLLMCLLSPVCILAPPPGRGGLADPMLSTYDCYIIACYRYKYIVYNVCA